MHRVQFSPRGLCTLRAYQSRVGTPNTCSQVSVPYNVTIHYGSSSRLTDASNDSVYFSHFYRQWNFYGVTKYMHYVMHAIHSR